MKLSNAVYWIWLSQVLGYNNPKYKMLYELYDDISELYTGGVKEWKLCGLLKQTEINDLKKASFSEAEKLVERCEKMGYKLISLDDREYPDCLRSIYAPPALLYVEGNLPDVDNVLTIAIVGTRRASNYGVSNSYKIGYSLSKYGVYTVSGGALGVDCASHRGTLAAGGVTICVLGCGINYRYLMENAGMRQAITKNGAVISEYPPDTPPKPYHFPARNRIIAGLSQGVVIIESGKSSGSLITADFALDMGRELFALLGNNSANNEGSNERIKEGTAIPITDFMDIITAFEGRYYHDEPTESEDISLADIEAVPVKGKKRIQEQQNRYPTRDYPYKTDDVINDDYRHRPEHKQDVTVTGEAKMIYEYLSAEPVHIDKICADLGIPIFKVLSALTSLEVKQLVKSEPGRYFSII